MWKNNIVRCGALIFVVGGVAFLGKPIWFPAVRDMVQTIKIPTKSRPKASGPFEVAVYRRKVLKPIPGAEIASGIEPGGIVVDLWYPKNVPGGERTLSNASACVRDVTRKPGSAQPITPNDDPADCLLPTVAFLAGWGGSSGGNSLISANLASYGFVVIAIDDIGYDAKRNASGLERPTDAAAATDFDMSSKEGYRRSGLIADRRLQLMVEKTDRVLRRMRDESNWPANVKLDLERVGALGFSFGGAVAAELTRQNDAVVAAVNMDGWLFGDTAKHGVQKPYLIFNSHYADLKRAARSGSVGRKLEAEFTIADRREQLRQVKQFGSVALIFPGAEHSDFTDENFTPSVRNWLKHFGRTSEDRGSFFKAINELIVVFFDQNVKRVSRKDDLSSVIAKYPALVRPLEMEAITK